MAPRELRRTRTVALGLLMVAGTVNYLDRSALAIGNAPIRESLGLSTGEMGLLLSAFAWSYGVAQIPVGVLVDRYGPRRLLSVGLLAWSAAQAAAGAATGLASFLAARLALGIGESPLYLAGTKVCTIWWGPRQRALPIGAFNASAALGPAIAPPVLTALIVPFGWRPTFVLLGVLGLATAIAWRAFYRDPAPGEDHGEEEPAPAAGAAADWRALLRTRTGWSMAAGFFGIVYITWLYGTWLPDYLHSTLHLSLRAIGVLAAVPQFCGFGGALLGGTVSNGLGRRGVAPITACTAPLIAGLALAAAATLGLAFTMDAATAVVLASVALFTANLASSCGWALAAVATGRDTVATLEAIQNVGGSVGGALAPAVTGFLVQASGGFTTALATGAAIALGSAAIYGFGVREPA